MKEPQLDLRNNEEFRSGLLDFSAFEYGPVEDVGVLEDSSVASLDSLDPLETIEENFWTSLELDKRDPISTNIKSWEVFYGQLSEDGPNNLFLSEGGPKTYDAVLIKSAEKADRESVASNSGHIIQSQALLSSLISLALGRESTVYCYNSEERSFRPRKNNVRMSGYSSQTFDRLSQSLRDQGKRFRDLQNFISETLQSSSVYRAYFALAGAFVPIMSSLESQIVCPSTPVHSLLQLQDLVERPGQLTRCLSEVVSKIQENQTDEQLLSKLFEFMLTLEHSPAWMLRILQGLLVSASRPWLDAVEQWLGIQHQGYLSPKARFPAFTLALETDASGELGFGNDTDVFGFDPALLPSFVSIEDAKAIFETGKSLRLLEVHMPKHPLTRQPRLAEDESIKLDWQFTWKDIEMVRVKANTYESRMRKALKDFASESLVTDQIPLQEERLELLNDIDPDQTKQSAQSLIDLSTAQFEKPLPDINATQQTCRGINSKGETIAFAPPMSLVFPLSFKPITSVCDRLINSATFRLFFRTHRLRTHFSLLHRFILMSDGVFASRLSQALFSPHISTTEWRPGYSLSGPRGLKLGHRDAWPPASSELRLALTGIIADSYFNSTLPPLGRSTYSSDLPGDISFAIRSMSSDELKACSDPNALYALDFLRIQYTPTAPLDSVITQKSLEKYDSIFKLLLRCSRMLFVVGQLNLSPRSSSVLAGAVQNRKYQQHMPFRNESRHFVSTICNHFFNNVSSHWQHLDQKLETLETIANSDSEQDFPNGSQDTIAEMESIGSIPALRSFHEQLLDNMMLALLLRKRQEQVMRLLEEIWGLVLRFAWLVKGCDEESADIYSCSGGGAEDLHKDVKVKTDLEIDQLHAQFRRKARVFVDVCRGLSERAQKDHALAGIGLGMEHLVLGFDMNGFYTRT